MVQRYETIRRHGFLIVSAAFCPRPQMDSLVPMPLSERQFWINYFSQKHAVKIAVAEEADRLAETNPGGRGFIAKTGASAHLRLQFVEAMRDAGIHLKLHQGTEVARA